MKDKTRVVDQSLCLHETHVHQHRPVKIGASSLKEEQRSVSELGQLVNGIVIHQNLKGHIGCGSSLLGLVARRSKLIRNSEREGNNVVYLKCEKT